MRDNLFVAYSIINSAINRGEELSVSSYNISQAFDSSWFKDTMSDLWEAKVSDDKFALIHKMNEECVVKVKTPVGDTDSFVLNEVEMQGTVLAPLKCSLTLDSIGRYSYRYQKGLYIYKNSVQVPPLWMIDDCLKFAKCGVESIVLNEMINTKLTMKKLKLNKDKCFNLHIGKNQQNCPKLQVHSETMTSAKDIKCLGDWISSQLDNRKTLKVVLI